MFVELRTSDVVSYRYDEQRGKALTERNMSLKPGDTYILVFGRGQWGEVPKWGRPIKHYFLELYGKDINILYDDTAVNWYHSHREEELNKLRQNLLIFELKDDKKHV